MDKIKGFISKAWGEAFSKPAGKEKKPDHGADHHRSYRLFYLYYWHGNLPLPCGETA